MSFSELRKISVHYEQSVVQNMIAMIKHAPYPPQAPLDAKTPWSLGIDYDTLFTLKHKFETEWSWDALEDKINAFDNFLVDYANGEDKLQLHFVHKRSPRADAIPLLIMHGWPGESIILACTA